MHIARVIGIQRIKGGGDVERARSEQGRAGQARDEVRGGVSEVGRHQQLQGSFPQRNRRAARRPCLGRHDKRQQR